MIRYLVDTNILSARREPALSEWLSAASSRLYLSAVTIAEIESGIAKKRREGAVRQADEIGAWRDAVLHLYGDRVLAFDIAVARIAGEMIDRARAAGQNPGFADIAIAATAQAHDLVLLTRNIRHLKPLGIRFADPFQTLPPDPA